MPLHDFRKAVSPDPFSLERLGLTTPDYMYYIIGLMRMYITSLVLDVSLHFILIVY